MKIISVVLISSMFYSFMACYSTKLVSNRNEIRNVVESGEGIYLYTRTEKYNLFSPYNYTVSNDTLIGNGRILSQNQSGSDKDVKIAVDDIHQIKVTEYDGTKTAILGGYVVVGFAIYYFLIKPQFDDMNLFSK